MVKLSYLQNVHSRNYIHRNIKPANILTGTQDSPNMVYLADFGIAKQYRHPNMHIHIPFRDGIPLTGTLAFASINSHMGAELSRCDDVESLAYVLIYFLWGSLPWLGAGDVDRVLQLKQGTHADRLCSGLPGAFKLILEHSCALAFTQRLDYNLLQSYIYDIREMLPDPNDTLFDWHHSHLIPSSPAATPVTSNGCVRSHKQTIPATVSSVPTSTRVYAFPVSFKFNSI